MSSTSPSRSPGRPRQFDTNAALDAAVCVFQEQGYHAASIADLNMATGLTAGSLYKAFTDKRGLFLAAFDRYVAQRHEALQQVLAEKSSGRGKIEAMLLFYADSASGAEGKRGCLVASSAMSLSLFDEEVGDRIQSSLQHMEKQLKRFLKEGQADGSIAPSINISATARNLLALTQGYRVIGKLGRTQSDMRAAVSEIMHILP